MLELLLELPLHLRDLCHLGRPLVQRRGDGVVAGDLGGLIVGGLGGALVGREIGKSGCHRTRTVYYEGGSRSRGASYQPAQPAPVRQVYYDHMGNPVATGSGGTIQPVSNATGGGVCRDANISYYDDRGRLNSRAVQICPR